MKEGGIPKSPPESLTPSPSPKERGDHSGERKPPGPRRGREMESDGDGKSGRGTEARALNAEQTNDMAPKGE